MPVCVFQFPVADPVRIVSLLPSATEITCGLGLRDQLVGVMHERDYSAGVSDLPKVTQTLIPHDATSGEIYKLVRAKSIRWFGSG